MSDADASGRSPARVNITGKKGDLVRFEVSGLFAGHVYEGTLSKDADVAKHVVIDDPEALFGHRIFRKSSILSWELVSPPQPEVKAGQVWDHPEYGRGLIAASAVTKRLIFEWADGQRFYVDSIDWTNATLILDAGEIPERRVPVHPDDIQVGWDVRAQDDDGVWIAGPATGVDSGFIDVGGVRWLKRPSFGREWFRILPAGGEN